MKVRFSDKLIAYITLLSGLTISAVAIYYSVAGLMAIFAAAVIPIIVMGVALEISKLAATVWLKQNWQRAPIFIRTYLLAAITILMIITSMGIFGFLSKAHSDQSLVSGDVMSKIAIYDEKIKTQKENIEANRKALKQMDEGVDQVLGRSTDEKGADKAVALRRAQQKERARLQAEISQSQKLIAELNDARAPIAAEVRKVEAEVGPIKYIAAFVYGETNETILEKAVTWVIIIIVSVFDPLAVILLLASQYSFQWFRQVDEEQETEGDSPPGPEPVVDNQPPTVTEQEEPKPEPFLGTPSPFWPFPTAKPVEEPIWQPVQEVIEPQHDPEEDDSDEGLDDEVLSPEKAAMKAWKAENPGMTIKRQRKRLERGEIDKLPWEEYLTPKPDYVKEAEKWAEENANTEEAKVTKEWAAEAADERPGDYLSYMENVDGHQVKKTIEGYTQNAEQNESTLWNRVKNKKS